MVLGIPDAYLGLIVGVLAVVLWIITNIHLVRTGRGIKTDIDSKRADTEQFVEDKLQTLQEQITNEIGEFEARFSVSYTKDMETIQENMGAEIKEIPRRISGMIHGPDGVEEKAFRAMVVDAEAEVEGEISVMEAVAAQDPRAMQVAIAQKIQKLGNDPEWQKEHQIGSLILEMGKPTLMNWVQTMTAQMQGAPSARLTTGGPSGKIYGT